MSSNVRSVYFIAHMDPLRASRAPVPVKIGVATHVESRLSGMQTGNPVPLELLGWGHGDEEEEQYLHEQFKAFHIRGEWFALNPALEGLIDEAKRDPHVLERLARCRSRVADPGRKALKVRSRLGAYGPLVSLDYIDIERLESRTFIDESVIRKWAEGDSVGKSADLELRDAAAALGIPVAPAPPKVRRGNPRWMPDPVIS